MLVINSKINWLLILNKESNWPFFFLSLFFSFFSNFWSCRQFHLLGYVLMTPVSHRLLLLQSVLVVMVFSSAPLSNGLLGGGHDRQFSRGTWRTIQQGDMTDNSAGGGTWRTIQQGTWQRIQQGDMTDNSAGGHDGQFSRVQGFSKAETTKSAHGLPAVQHS